MKLVRFVGASACEVCFTLCNIVIINALQNLLFRVPKLMVLQRETISFGA